MTDSAGISPGLSKFLAQGQVAAKAKPANRGAQFYAAVRQAEARVAPPAERPAAAVAKTPNREFAAGTPPPNVPRGYYLNIVV